MKKSESGYALLVVLLTMAVGLTIGLSVISRSTTDIRISYQEEESARAFSAAEAGLEKALIGESLEAIGGINVSVVESVQGGGSVFDFGNRKFQEGDTQTVWLTEYKDGEFGGDSWSGDEISICWGKDERPAIEIAIIYKSGESFEVVRGAYDPDAAIRGNGFDSPEDSVDPAKCGDLDFEKDIKLSHWGVVNPYMLRLRLLYNSTAQPLRVWGDADFPPQGNCYTSTATIPSSGIARKVQQCQFYKSPPGIFDYVLFSEGDLTK